MAEDNGYVLILVLLFATYISECKFPHLRNGHSNSAQITRVEKMLVKYLA